MKNFWKWMTKQGYYHEGHTYSESMDDKALFSNNKNMLIGYMEEYLLIEHGLGLGNSSCIYIQLDKGKKYSDIRHDQLEAEIIKQTERKGV